MWFGLQCTLVETWILHIYGHNFVRTFAKNISVRGGQCGLE